MRKILHNQKQLFKSKQGFEMSFAWIFAMIVGAVILFLAIYAATSFIRTARYSYDTQTANTIKNYLNPLVTGVASATSPPPIKFREETRTYINCNGPDPVDFFGTQEISFTEKSGLGNNWGKPGGNITIYNKYVFANEVEEGDTLYLSAFPFYTGFKVDDLITLNAGKYCFIQAPNTVEKKSIIFQNVNLTASLAECKENEVKVCFGNVFYDGCDMLVSSTDNEYRTGYVIKENGERLDFFDNLLYAAIFSSPDNYNCNIDRLGKKISELAYIYEQKIGLAQIRECNSIIGPYLGNIAQVAPYINNTEQLYLVYEYASLMDELNEKALCQIYTGEDY